MINDYIENFVNKYANGYQMFNEQNAHGNGTIEDLSVLSWMYYEGIYTTEEELSEATAYLLGKALVRYAGLEWAEINISHYEIIILTNREHNYIFAPLEYTAMKSRLLSGNNYGVEDLFVDAILLLEYDMRDEKIHPLFALEYSEEYQDEIGFTLPSMLNCTLKKLWEQDAELLIRGLGVEFYELYLSRDWEIIESKVKNIDLDFAEKYHKNNVWQPIYKNTERILKFIDTD